MCSALLSVGAKCCSYLSCRYGHMPRPRRSFPFALVGVDILVT